MPDNSVFLEEIIFEPNSESEEALNTLTQRVMSLLSNPNLPESEKEKLKANPDLALLVKTYGKQF